MEECLGVGVLGLGANTRFGSGSMSLFKQHFLYFFPLPQEQGWFLRLNGSTLVPRGSIMNAAFFPADSTIPVSSLVYAALYGFTSSPYDGWLKVPPIRMGTISPASFFLNNGSTDLSRTDFTPFDPFESFLSTCKVP